MKVEQTQGTPQTTSEADLLQKLQLFYIKNKFLDYLSYFGGGRGVVSLREAELMVFHFPSFSQNTTWKMQGIYCLSFWDVE